MKKILLTGGNGFFSTRFADFYKDKYEILSVGKNDLDVQDADKVIKVFRGFKPDYVIHAAAIAVTDFCNKHPEIAHDINVKGAVNVGKACKEVGAKMIFISTEQVFNGNMEKGPYDEQHTAVPDTVYGQNKLEAEGLLKEMLEELWILRFTWLFGLPIEGCKVSANIVWNTLESILKGEKIVAPTNEYRGMTYIRKLLENFDKVFDIPYGTYHIGSENALNRYEIVHLIIEELGIGSKLNVLLEADTEKYKENPRDVRLDTGKIYSLGIKFGTTKEGIKRCIKEEVKKYIEEHKLDLGI
jgi:dTDP-4-dehydrorhamnose reductase